MSSGHMRNLGIVSGATLCSRVLGLLREVQAAAVFGTSALASAFVVAFTLPNLFRRLLGEGALTAALVPTLQSELHRGARPAAFALVSQVASWLAVVTGGLVVVATTVFATAGAWLPVAGRWGVEPDTLARWQMGAALAVWLFPYLVVVCMAAAFSAALQTLGRFLEPALSPIWLNVAMIGLLWGATHGWAETDLGRMHWLCAGVLVGGFFQMAVPAAALAREGWRPQLDLRLSEPVREILRLMGPTVFSSAVYLVNMAVSRLIGLSLDESSAAVLNFATRLMELPIGVFAVAVSTVVFPLIAQRAAERDFEGLAVTYRRGLRLILMVNTPAAAGLAVLSAPVIRVIFQRGEFGVADTLLMTPVMIAMALALPLLSFVNLALRAFYAHKDTVTPVKAAVWSFIVNVGLSLVLMRWLGTLGLAVAGTVAAAVQAGYLQVKLSGKQAALGFAPLAADAGRIVAASLVMAAAVAGVHAGIGRMGLLPLVRDIAALGIGIPTGVAVYAGALWAMGFAPGEELGALLAKLRRR